jgi:hypothetical protein
MRPQHFPLILANGIAEMITPLNLSARQDLMDTPALSLPLSQWREP